MLKEFFQEIFCQVPEPKVLGTMTLYEVDNYFKELKIRVNLSDEYFCLTSVAEAKKFTQETKVSTKSYIASGHDCDNFSYALLGYWSNGLKSFAFGYARSSTHAFNVMFDENKDLWVCEPQTNKWFKYSDNKEDKYVITEVMI